MTSPNEDSTASITTAHGRDPLIEAVTQVRDLGANPKLRLIRLKVAQAYGFTPAELIPDDRNRGPLSARTTIMILAFLCTRRPLADIGRLLKRDHTTVYHAVRKRCGITVDSVRTAFLNEAPDRGAELESIETWRRARARGRSCTSSRVRRDRGRGERHPPDLLAPSPDAGSASSHRLELN
jgi:Bacterial dnaA protein helix-turn-helix